MSQKAEPTDPAKDKPRRRIRTLIVSGLSGSGKTTAIRALEDVGFFCVDNLPVELLAKFLALCARALLSKVAVVIDVRELTFLTKYEERLARVLRSGYGVETLFLTCDEEALVRRYKETRRQHPLQGEGGLLDGIRAERAALEVVESSATHVLDTTGKNVHALRRAVQEMFRGDLAGPLHVRLQSFGFKHGLPDDADYVFDVRFLPNPYFVEELRDLTGRDAAVAAFVDGQEDTRELQDLLTQLLAFVLPRAQREGRSQITVSIGCTGGRHRSVALVEWLGKRMESEPYRVTTLHRDLDKG